MNSLLFLETKQKHVLNSEFTIFSNIHDQMENCETIVLNDIQTKHCAIVKKDHAFQIIDLCSFDTKLYIKDGQHPHNLKPMTYYELRDSDRIFIGNHEILFCSEPDNNKKAKVSFFVPETQPFFEEKYEPMINEDHVEIPETQNMESEILTDEFMDDIKPAKNNNLRKEFLVETQPLHILPPFTRARREKQEQIKPKTVPLSAFNFSSSLYSEESQKSKPIKKQPPNHSKFSMKRRLESDSSSSKSVINSLLLSEEDSDSDDDRNRSNVIKVEETFRRSTETDENSMNVSISNDFDSIDVPSSAFDSQFLNRLNEMSSSDDSSDGENVGFIMNHKFEEDKKIVKSESIDANKSIKRESDIKVRPRKRIKLFDDDDDFLT